MSTTNKIRGVNLGGWMVLENFITPYFFSLSDCHLKGDFRYYPGQVDAPPEGSALHKYMNHTECSPLPKHPIDEWTFVKTFRDANNGSGAFAQQYLDIHYDNFVKKEDLKALKAGGITHLRVPIGHWILGDITDDEPYVEGGWKYMKRLADWCREEGLQVWLDLHTAPGSQNGFDNSGHLGPKPSCNGWDESYYNFFKTETLAPNVVRTLKIIDHITEQVAKDGMTDVVTGFGLLNEPFADCNYFSLVKFYEEGFNIVRANMGEETGVYVADSFNPGRFNGFAWKDAKYKNTYLDSHFYQTFEAKTRALSPRQHIATVWYVIVFI
jgi:glucan 1,3-beta-glucosidase